MTGRSHAGSPRRSAASPPQIRRVDRDETLITDLTAIEAEFWELVEARTPPALEGPASAGLVARLYPDADPMAEAKFESGDLAAMLREYQQVLAAETEA